MGNFVEIQCLNLLAEQMNAKAVCTDSQLYLSRGTDNPRHQLCKSLFERFNYHELFVCEGPWLLHPHIKMRLRRNGQMPAQNATQLRYEGDQQSLNT
jgi:hypothetical protein